MRTGRRLILCLLLVFGITLQASAAPIPLIIQLTPVAKILTVLPIIGGTLVDSIPGSNLYLVNVPQIPVVSNLLMSLLGVQSMEVNNAVPLLPDTAPALLQLGTTQPAQWYAAQPSFVEVNAASALAYSTGKGVVVADINSQVDVSHPALAGHMTSGYDFIANQPSTETSLNQSDASFLDQSDASFLDQSDASFLDQSDASFLDNSGVTLVQSSNPAYGHGTMCAGIIAAIAPNAMIMPLRAFNDQGDSDLWTLAKAIRYAVTNGAQVINMSFGTLTNSNAIQNAIQFAEQSHIILAASAGNNDTSAPQYPAAYSGVLTVASTDLTDTKASFSNFGNYVAVDAPGVNIISAYPGDQYSMASGTSFSSPMVAGEAALLRSLQINANDSSVSGATVNINSENPTYVNQLGSGRINILQAVHP